MEAFFLADIGQRYLREAVLLVLFDWSEHSEGLTPTMIRKRAGISGLSTNEHRNAMVYAVLAQLEDQGKVRSVMANEDGHRRWKLTGAEIKHRMEDFR